MKILMNKVCLIGRLTANPELRYNNSNISYTRFTLAVNRNFTNEKGERKADFISCVACKKTAELICEYFNKGSQIGIEGKIQTGSYETPDGNKRYTTDVIVDNITFLDKKQDSRPEPEYVGKQNNSENQDIDLHNYPKEEEYDPFIEFGDSVSIDDNFLD